MNKYYKFLIILTFYIKSIQLLLIIKFSNEIIYFFKNFNIKLADYLVLRKDSIIKEHHLFIQNTIEPQLMEDFF